MDTKEAGRLGGLSRSPKKLAAVRANAAKALAARQARKAAQLAEQAKQEGR